MMVTSSVSCFGFRISDGTVFTKNGGFRLFLGQPNEFPIMQVTYHICTLAAILGETIKLFRPDTFQCLLEKSTRWN